MAFSYLAWRATCENKRRIRFPIPVPVPASLVESSAPEGCPNSDDDHATAQPALVAATPVPSLPALSALTSAHPASWSSTTIDYAKLTADTKALYKGIDYKDHGSWPGAHLLIQNQRDSGVLQFFFEMKNELWVNDAFEFQQTDSKQFVKQVWENQSFNQTKAESNSDETCDTTDDTTSTQPAAASSQVSASAVPAVAASSSASSSAPLPPTVATRQKPDEEIVSEIAKARYRKLHASEYHMRATALYSIDRFKPPSDSWVGEPTEIHFKPTKRAPQGQPHIVRLIQLLRASDTEFLQEEEVEDHSYFGEIKSAVPASSSSSLSSSAASASSSSYSSSSSSSSIRRNTKTVRARLAVSKKYFGMWAHFDRRVTIQYGLVELQWRNAKMKWGLFCTNMVCRDIAKVDQPIVSQLYVPYPALNVRYCKLWIHPDYLNIQALIIASIFEEFEFMTIVG